MAVRETPVWPSGRRRYGRPGDAGMAIRETPVGRLAHGCALYGMDPGW
jgi:hypothetical protein